MGLLGKQAPDFTLESTANKQITLLETLERGPTVVILFRGSWCSSCAEQLGTFSDLSYDLWYNHDTDILPVSSDSVGDLIKMRDRYNMKIQLLSEPDYATTSAYTEMVEHEWREDYPDPEPSWSTLTARSATSRYPKRRSIEPMLTSSGRSSETGTKTSTARHPGILCRGLN